MTPLATGSVGAAVERRDASVKVRGEALYAYEYPVEGVAYGVLVQSRVARGRITRIDSTRALALPGVLTVISHENAPRLNPTGSAEVFLFQEPRVSYYGQIVAAVVAESLEVAREATALVSVEVETEPHDVTLRRDHPGFFRPDRVSGRISETRHGDVEAALAVAPVVVSCTYTTPAQHNMPMEPHASLAIWERETLTVFDSNQHAHGVRASLAETFGLDPDQVRVINAHVGGAFGSKGSASPQLIVAAMSARMLARPVKIALTRARCSRCPAIVLRRSRRSGWARTPTEG